MEIMKKNYKLMLAVVIGAAIGSILTQPTVNNMPHGHNEHKLTDIATLIGTPGIGTPGSTIPSNNQNSPASNTKTPGGNKISTSHKNSAVTQATTNEHEHYRSVATGQSNTKRANKENVKLADALD